MKSQNKYIRNKTALLCWLCGCIGLFSSCVEVSVEERATQSYLIIHPDDSEYTLPAVMYHFYNVGEPGFPLRLPGDENGCFEGSVPAGTYRVIATNLDATGVVFEQMDDPDEATVKSASQITRIPDLHYLEQPGPVYSVAMGEFTATDKDTAYHYPKPALLTKTLIFRFTLQEELQTEVNALRGVLRGVYPTVHLFSFQPVQSGVSISPSMAVHFQTTPSTRSAWSTNISLFGICDPKYGTAYRNLLYITLEMNDHTTIEVEVELTNTLSEIIENNDGEIPIEVPVDIHITQTPVGAQGEVVPWKPGGENDTILKTKQNRL